MLNSPYHFDSLSHNDDLKDHTDYHTSIGMRISIAVLL